MSVDQVTQYLTLHNRRDHAIDLWIEPWGDRVSMRANTSYVIAGTGPGGGTFEVEMRDDDFAVHGWAGSTLEVFADNERVCRCSVPVPEMPVVRNR